MKFDIESTIHISHSEVTDQLWNLYYNTFEPLEELALLSHLYSRDAFVKLLRDMSVIKIVAWDGNKVVGLAILTSNLESVPQISPRFLRKRYPEYAERNAIYFGIMVLVDEEHRGSSLAARLIAAQGQYSALNNGIIVFDVCQHNIDLGVVNLITERVSGWFPNSIIEEIDSQHYFAYTTPEPGVLI